VTRASLAVVLACGSTQTPLANEVAPDVVAPASACPWLEGETSPWRAEVFPQCPAPPLDPPVQRLRRCDARGADCPRPCRETRDLDEGHGTVTEMTYDASGRWIASVPVPADPDRRALAIRYDHDGVAAIEVSEGARRGVDTIRRDDAGRIVEIAHPKRGPTLLVYTPWGAVERVDRIGYGPIELAYDDHHRLVHERSMWSDITYRYDAVGYLTEQAFSATVTTFRYDARHRLIHAMTAGLSERSFVYDASDRLVQITSEGTPLVRYDYACR
jgi:YD repeat-containing protein